LNADALCGNARDRKFGDNNMYASRFAIMGAIAMWLSAPSWAALKGDFGGLAMCSNLKALPKGHRVISCKKCIPLRGECKFVLSSNGMPIEYLIENGVVQSKNVKLVAGAKFVAPYGLSVSDNPEKAVRKIKKSTGLSSKTWTDDDENSSYLQSEDVMCSKSKSYVVYVWFDNEQATNVSVSTLPAI
jgi:hypothetical protein